MGFNSAFKGLIKNIKAVKYEKRQKFARYAYVAYYKDSCFAKYVASYFGR